MKALVYTADREVTYRDEPEPVADSGDALVSIESVGICGSDMHAWLGHDARRVPPLILGHEAVGTVLQGSRPGSRVVLNPLITCGVCDHCLDGRQNLCAERDLIGMYRAGAFAEQIAIPERNLIPVPDGLDSDKAALTEPGATALHAITLAERALSRPVSEARTLVIGAGSVGLLAALILRDKGAASISIMETNKLRSDTARRYCQLHCFSPKDVTPKESSYDLVIDAVGGGVTRDAAVSSVRPGGMVVHIGLMDEKGPLDIRRITLQEITLIGCYTYSPLDMRMMLEKLHSGKLGDLTWIERRPLRDGAQAFRDLHDGLCAAPKVVLTT
jgi:alcohol dehydrogenase